MLRFILPGGQRLHHRSLVELPSHVALGGIHPVDLGPVNGVGVDHEVLHDARGGGDEEPCRDTLARDARELRAALLRAISAVLGIGAGVGAHPVARLDGRRLGAGAATPTTHLVGLAGHAARLAVARIGVEVGAGVGALGVRRIARAQIGAAGASAPASLADPVHRTRVAAPGAVVGITDQVHAGVGAGIRVAVGALARGAHDAAEAPLVARTAVIRVGLRVHAGPVADERGHRAAAAPAAPAGSGAGGGGAAATDAGLVAARLGGLLAGATLLVALVQAAEDRAARAGDAERDPQHPPRP